MAVTSQVLAFGLQLAAGHGRSSRVPSDCSCLQATMVCDLVLLYLDAKAEVYWKEKFEEVRRRLCREARLEGSSPHPFHPFLLLGYNSVHEVWASAVEPFCRSWTPAPGLGGCSESSLAHETHTSLVMTSSRVEEGPSWRRSGG